LDRLYTLCFHSLIWKFLQVFAWVPTPNCARHWETSYSEIWGWQSQEYSLQKDLLAGLHHTLHHSFCPKDVSTWRCWASCISDLADPCSSLWAEASNNLSDDWSMFDEQTPIKHCTDFEFQFCDIGGNVLLSWLWD